MPWREWLLNNLSRKLIALGFATLLYLAVRASIEEDFRPFGLGGNLHTRLLSGVPVSIVTGAEDPRNFKLTPREVAVTVRGPAESVKALTPADLNVFVDLTGVQEATGLKKKIRVYTPAGIDLDQVQPPVVDVHSVALPNLSSTNANP
jgi:YbbR domain-containing protein